MRINFLLQHIIIWYEKYHEITELLKILYLHNQQILIQILVIQIIADDEVDDEVVEEVDEVEIAIHAKICLQMPRQIIK
jgi:hypothetical protein